MMMTKKALITGVTGQDGSYLSELLLAKGYHVTGVVRRSATPHTTNILPLLKNTNFKIIEGDIADPSSVNEIIREVQPNYCVNAAAQSHVFTSFHQPSYTIDVDLKGPLYLLEAIRLYSPSTRFLQCSSSEMFGSNYSKTEILYNGMSADDERLHTPDLKKHYKYFQNENTPLAPNSPYAIAKTAAHHLVRMYRDAYKIHASASISFNHEGERRGENFVTRKITKWIAGAVESFNGSSSVFKSDCGKLQLGNLKAIRDWGHAIDYVRAMWLMLQQDEPDDYVIGTGEGHSVEDFLREAFSYVGANWRDYVEIDPELYRPCEVRYLCADASKAQLVLGWTPTISFAELVHRMINRDLRNAGK